MTVSPDFELYADQKTFNTSVPPSWQNAFRALLPTIAKPPAEIRFLDLGCGDGKFFQYLQDEGLSLSNIHGVEVSQKRVDRCHAMGWSSVKFMEPGSALPYADGSFDIVNMMEVVEHVPAETIGGLLAEVRRVMAPAARLFITTPNYPIKRFYDFHNAIVHGHYARFRDDPTHVSPYNHARLERLLGRHFGTIEEHTFKDGFLYRRIPRPFFRHKMFFICSGDAMLVPAS